MSVRNRGRAVNVPGRVQASVFEEGSRWLPKTETSQQGIDYARPGIHNDRRPESDFFLVCPRAIQYVCRQNANTWTLLVSVPDSVVCASHVGATRPPTPWRATKASIPCSIHSPAGAVSRAASSRSGGLASLHGAAGARVTARARRAC